MNKPVVLEVCVDSVASATAAERGGADRVELCSNLLEGGVTPSAGMISTVRANISIGLHVLIRPRPGDFLYSGEEFQTMEQDVITAKELGADGIVVGILSPDGEVDLERSRHLIDLARPLEVTFHRAFDMSNDLDQALEDIISIGAKRVLSSGGEQTAEKGLVALKHLMKATKERIIIMAGAGIDESNVGRIIQQSGVREIHASAKAAFPSCMRYRNEKVSMGMISGREYQRAVVFEENVERLLRKACEANARVNSSCEQLP